MSSKFNLHLLFAIIAAALNSGFQHGYHTGVINVPQEVMKDWVNETYEDKSEKYADDNLGSLLWGITTSIMNAGGTLGGLVSGVFAHKLGPKYSLIYNNILVVIATVLMGIAKPLSSFESMVIGRFVIGVNCGLNAGLCPMYLSEISEVSVRGAISTVYQLVITISILIAQIVGLGSILGTEELWPYLFILPIFLAIFQMIALTFCSDSPRYILVIKNDEAKATKHLEWLRGGPNVANVSEEMSQMKHENEVIKSLPTITWKDMFTQSKLWKPLLIALMMMVAQQFSGINAVIFYSADTFMKAGLTKENAQYATVGIGVVNVLTTVASLFLVESLGRKTLLLAGFGGMGIITALLTVTLYFTDKNDAMPWVCIILTFIYIILFACGAGPIPWFLVTEIFNQSARPKAVSLAVPVNWIANFLVTLTFPSIQYLIGPFVFLIFVCLNVVFFLLILKFVPETKNKSIEEITAQFE